jgi:hypothetical protein
MKTPNRLIPFMRRIAAAGFCPAGPADRQAHPRQRRAMQTTCLIVSPCSRALDVMEATVEVRIRMLSVVDRYSRVSRPAFRQGGRRLNGVHHHAATLSASS